MEPPHNRIGVVVNYCSLERPFLARCVQECLAFAGHVVVARGTRLHDGRTPEPDLPPGLPDAGVAYVTYDVDGPREPEHYPNLARLTGFEALDPACDWVLFLDADEICEGARMREFAEAAELDPRTGYKLAMYWYFRSTDLQSLMYEDSAVLVHRGLLAADTRRKLLECPVERQDIVDLAPGGVLRNVADAARTPMIHHYSWVRGDDEALLTKVRVWSHRHQRDWETALRAELARPVLGHAHTDMVFGKSYRRIDAPYFELPQSPQSPQSPQGADHTPDAC